MLHIVVLHALARVYIIFTIMLTYFLRDKNPTFVFLCCRYISQSVVKMSKDVQTHYEVLGLTSSASQTDIRSAFLQLSKQV